MPVANAAAKSWRTTALGFIGGLMLLLPEIQAVLDTDPGTNPAYQAIIAALALMGLGINTRDHSVTSEKAGAK